MSGHPPTADVAADAGRESDRDLERLGDFDEGRCLAAPAEVRADVDRTLTRAFPEPRS